jgi:PAS domain S-box-containing protein
MDHLLDDQPSAPAGNDGAIEQVLLGLADGSYVLSTPDGAVAECGIGVVGLLGAPADRLVGRPTADVLVAGADVGARTAFDQLLRGDGAAHAAPPTFVVRTASGATRSLRFVVVAVPLALGWEFTSLLSELGSRDAGTWHPEALRLRHGHALEAIEGVVREQRQPDPSARLAGILIVVRDVDAPELTREDVDRRMAEQRDAAHVAVAEAARRKDAAAGRAAGLDVGAADEHPGLDDLVERARVLRERLEDAEQAAATAVSERDDALAKLAEADAERDALRARASSVRAADDGRVEQLTGERDEALWRLETASRELDSARAEAAGAVAETAALRDAVHAERAAHNESAGAELVALRAEVEAAEADANGLRAELQGAHGETALARGEAAAIRANLQSAREELETVRAELTAREGERNAAHSALQAHRTELAGVREELTGARTEADETRAELEAVRADLARTRSELDASLAATEDVRGEREQMRERAQQLLGEAERARAAADAIRAEFAFDVDPVVGEALAGPTAHDAPATAAPSWPGGPPPLPADQPGQAVALISFDGQFKRLDEAFCSLLGCHVEDLRAARWPSIIDRENLHSHQEIARALRAGEVQSAEIETVYMHAQGLLVPIAGTVSLYRADPHGAPTHFLLRADVSRTAGAPS